MRENLKKARKEAGMTQEQMAERLGSSVKIAVLYDGALIVCSNGEFYRRQRNGYYKQVAVNPSRLDGYIRISIKVHGRMKLFMAHRLVAETFLANPDNYPVVNHKDYNRANNSLENLEWCSHKFNILHSIERHKQQYLTALKVKRKSMKLTTNKVAREIGMMIGPYRDIENGVRKPTEKESRRLEDFFGTSIESLLIETEEGDE